MHVLDISHNKLLSIRGISDAPSLVNINVKSNRIQALAREEFIEVCSSLSIQLYTAALRIERVDDTRYVQQLHQNY